MAQGIGWALNEQDIYDKDGRLENPGFLNYRVPVAPDVPMIDAVMVENANPRHPFGVAASARWCRSCRRRRWSPTHQRRDRGQDARPADVDAAATRRDRQKRRVSPSPVVLKMRPWCSPILGSISPAVQLFEAFECPFLVALDRPRVATSAARIAARGGVRHELALRA